MPLAAIVTPGSLTVALIRETTSKSGRVPTLNFQANFGTTVAISNDFNAANSDVVRVGLASATSGSILTMQPPEPNSSYVTTFHGPALQCSPMNSSDLTAINTIVNVRELRNILEYMAWAPGQGDPTINYTYAPLQMPGQTNAEFSPPIQANGPSYPDPGYNVYVYSPQFFQAYLIRCALYNVTYTVNFTFSAGSQDLHIQKGPEKELIPLGAVAALTPTPQEEKLNLTQKYNEAIAYLSIMYSFGSIVTGSVTSSAQTGIPIVQSTIIQSTNLATYIQQTIPSELISNDNSSVCTAFEELFQNITFSMFSLNNYLLNESDPTQVLSMQTPQITSSVFVNKYTYNAQSLGIAYGLALIGEVICLAAGFYALYRNRVAFTNGFSTILRTTRNRELAQLVDGNNFNGSDPVPEHTLDARITYHLSNDQTAGFDVK